MKVGEYLNDSDLSWVDESFNDKSYLSSELVKKGPHKIKFFIKVNGDKIEDIKFFSSKRCKKLLAIANYVSNKFKGRDLNELKNLDFQEIINFFDEEKEIEKMKDRFNLIKEAIISLYKKSN